MSANAQMQVQPEAAGWGRVPDHVMDRIVAKAYEEAEAIEKAKARAADAAKLMARERAGAGLGAARVVRAVNPKAPPKRGDWEFLWRFIAVAMMFEIAWVVWIAVQINPPPIALPAAFAAAAKARANRNLEGQIVSASPAESVETPGSADTLASSPAVPVDPPVQREPLVNMEKLKLAESIETAIVERLAESAK